MAEDKIQLDIIINTADSANSIGDIKKSIKELNNAALTVGAGGKGFDALTKKAADLKDKLEDLNDSTKSLKGTGIEKLNSSLGLLKEGFSNVDPQKIGTGFKVIGTAMKAIPIFLIIEGIKFLVENFDKLANSGGLLGKVFGAIKDYIMGVIQVAKDLTDWLGITSFAIEDKAEKTIEAAKKEGEAISARYDDEIKLAKAAGKETFQLEIDKQKAVIASAIVQVNALKTIAQANGTLSAEQLKNLEALVTTIHNSNIEIQAQTLAHNKDLKDKDDKRKEESITTAKETAKQKKAIQDKEWADYLAAAKDSFDKLVQQYKKDSDAFVKAQTDKYQIAKKLDEDTTNLVLSNMALEAQLSQDKTKIEQARWQKELSDYKFVYDEKGKITSESQANLELLKKVHQDKLDTITEESNKKQSESISKYYTSVTAILNEQNQLINSNYITLLGGLTSFVGQLEQLSNQKFEKYKEDWMNQVDMISQYAQAAASVALQVVSAIQANNKAKLDENLTNIEDTATREQEVLQNKYNLGLISQKQFEAQSKAISDKAKIAELDAKKKAFEEDKKLKVAQAIISGISGAVAAFAGAMTLGPIAGPIVGGILAAAVMGLTAANVSKIQSTQFNGGGGADTGGSPQINTGGDTGAAAPAPRLSDFSLYGTAGKNNNVGTESSTTTSPVVRAVVLESDITTVQLRNANFKKSSEL